MSRPGPCLEAENLQGWLVLVGDNLGDRYKFGSARLTRAERIGHGRMDLECATGAVASRLGQRLAHYHPWRARDGHARACTSLSHCSGAAGANSNHGC